MLPMTFEVQLLALTCSPDCHSTPPPCRLSHRLWWIPHHSTPLPLYILLWLLDISCVSEAPGLPPAKNLSTCVVSAFPKSDFVPCPQRFWPETVLLPASGWVAHPPMSSTKWALRECLLNEHVHINGTAFMRAIFSSSRIFPGSFRKENP